MGGCDEGHFPNRLQILTLSHLKRMKKKKKKKIHTKDYNRLFRGEHIDFPDKKRPIILTLARARAGRGKSDLLSA